VLAVEAGRTILIDQPDVVRIANERAIAIVALEAAVPAVVPAAA
jgi:hypothetical protein